MQSHSFPPLQQKKKIKRIKKNLLKKFVLPKNFLYLTKKNFVFARTKKTFLSYLSLPIYTCPKKPNFPFPKSK